MRHLTIRLTVVVGTLLVGLAAVPAHANLVIQLDAQGCATGVVDQSPGENCPAEVACRDRGASVRWVRSDGSGDFSIAFQDSSLFQNWGTGQCNSTPDADKSIVCVISQEAALKDYKYDVGTSNCPALDPYIRVRS